MDTSDNKMLSKEEMDRIIQNPYINPKIDTVGNKDVPGIAMSSTKAIVHKVNFNPNISDEELRKMIDDLYANDNSQEREFILWCNPEVKDAFLKALDIAIKEEVTKMNDNEEVSK